MNDIQKKIMFAAQEIENTVNLSKELYFVAFGVTVSTKFWDDQLTITAKWWIPNKQETSVIISCEMLADYDKPIWGETIRTAFNLLDQRMKEERFKEFQRRKIYGPKEKPMDKPDFESIEYNCVQDEKIANDFENGNYTEGDLEDMPSRLYEANENRRDLMKYFNFLIEQGEIHVIES